MPSEPLILAFDTSAAYCAAALLSGTRILDARSEAMTRGQAERLMPLLHEMLDDANLTWRDLTAIGVGVGPGNFTGIRIAVSAARGLALGLDAPAVGVSGCEARAHLARTGTCPAIPAPRDMVYLCDPNDPSCVPRLLPHSEADDKARASGLRLEVEYSPENLAGAIAHITAARWQSSSLPPAPLYVRPADAAPSRDAPPVMLD